MKDETKMNHEELLEYVRHLKNMIRQLQAEISKLQKHEKEIHD